MKNQIFEVDVKGLRQLQEGKPKWFIVRELLQNAIDENITTCNIDMSHQYGKAHITVQDDSPTGFRDLSDAYTLFKDTYKRTDIKKRGRFNFGEKQVLCLVDYARIVTTTGGIEFNMLKGKRTTLRKKREKGSVVYVVVNMTKDEFNECRDYCLDILVPQNIKINVNAEDYKVKLPYRNPYKTFITNLPTEIKENDKMKIVTRETEVHIHKGLLGPYVYEMGIPVCEIDCDYSIDVQQKVPLSNDRDKIDTKYLKTLYGEVLNKMINEITPEQSSALWVRDGFTSDRAQKETRKEVITKRYGEKSLIANPMDKRSMDEAISNNFNVVYGSEMSKEEWLTVKNDDLLVSTSSMFKTGIAEGKSVTPNEKQKRIADFSIKVAYEILNLNIKVSFYDSPDATVRADYNNQSNQLRFNVAHISSTLWNSDNNDIIKQEMLDLIIHELGHSEGLHYEHSYHECLTELGSKLTIKAINEPEFFKL